MRLRTQKSDHPLPQTNREGRRRSQNCMQLNLKPDSMPTNGNSFALNESRRPFFENYLPERRFWTVR